MKPLFVPLKTEYWRQFRDGTKRDELRLYGPRWNETKAMEVVGGCVVQVTTQQKNIDGTYSVAEALTYVPGAKIADDENNGRRLVQL